MEKDLISIIANYFVKKISDNIKDDISIYSSYNSEMNHFVIKFELVNTQFLIIARGRNSRNSGMTIEPDEHLIKIECQNYLKNFEQVVNIIGQFEKELKNFDRTFPSAARRQYIRKNHSLINKSRTATHHRNVLSFNILSEKYLEENHLKDEYGAKEIALDHLFSKEYFINMKKKN